MCGCIACMLAPCHVALRRPMRARFVLVAFARISFDRFRLYGLWHAQHARLALAAAKAIHADPDHVRGSPWLSLRLSKANKAEVAAVAKCKDLASLPQVAAELGPRSRLAMHLKELKFERAAS